MPQPVMHKRSRIDGGVICAAILALVSILAHSLLFPVLTLSATSCGLPSILEMASGYTSVSAHPLCACHALTTIFADVKTDVWPNPHTAINKNHSALAGYTAMMFIFGFVRGIVNLVTSIYWYHRSRDAWHKRETNCLLSSLFWFFQIFVAVPAWIFLIVGPFFAGFIVPPIVKHVSQSLAFLHTFH